MNGKLFACAWAAEFPAQALLRLRTDWQTEPVVVLDGRAPEEWVSSLNRLAERRGAAVGMTRLEAESLQGLRLLKRSAESEAAARAVMLECAAKFSPRIEEVNGGAGLNEASTLGAGGGTACAFALDIAGTERLFGPPAQLAERLREELVAAGFRASIAVSANFDTARMKAASMRGIAVIAKGAEAEALAKLPIAALGLDEEYAATFALWGIGTLGELAALPEVELVARMGPKARAWRALARGEAEHTFEPIEAEFALEEFCEFETPVEQIDSLLFVGARMIDCLVTRAAGRALALRSLTAEMGLEGGGTHGCAIRPAVPTIDGKFLLKLLQLEIGAHPPQAAVVRLALRAEAGAQSKVQLGLFAPQTPEPSRLDVTLARLRAMVGEERVGSPVLEDTHRADGFRMEGFAANGGNEAEIESTPRMALRRVRPARLVRVTVRATKPAVIRDRENSYEIAAAYGPWRTSGCWWAMEAWDTEEWDVLAVRAEKLPAGAKAHNHFASDTARDPPTGWVPRPCPDTSCLSDEISLQSVKSWHDSQPNLSACTANSNSATIACLLTHDRTRNAWRLEAFYD
ncbi:MAG: DNA polymerase Y family protein [Terracidiphilus sp.]